MVLARLSEPYFGYMEEGNIELGGEVEGKVKRSSRETSYPKVNKEREISCDRLTFPPTVKRRSFKTLSME